MTSDQNACACYVVLDRELQVVHQEVGMMLTSALNYFYHVLPVHHLVPFHVSRYTLGYKIYFK